jgi:hypothetical protein
VSGAATASHSLLPSLHALRDIDGVMGSFVWRNDGLVLAWDVPASCPKATLEAVAQRMQRLCDAFCSIGDAFQGTTIAFAHYKLHVSRCDGAYVAVVLSQQINMSALKMALNLTCHDLADVLLDVELEPLIEADAQDTSHAASQAEPNNVRLYRGQRITE